MRYNVIRIIIAQKPCNLSLLQYPSYRTDLNKNCDIVYFLMYILLSYVGITIPYKEYFISNTRCILFKIIFQFLKEIALYFNTFI